MAKKNIKPQELSGIEGKLARSPIYKIMATILGLAFLGFGLFQFFDGMLLGIVPLMIGIAFLYQTFKK